MARLTDFALLNATVMHKRLKPSKNAFSYQVYYVALPLNPEHPFDLKFDLKFDLNEAELRKAGLSYNRFGIHAIYHQDHGYRDGRSWRQWLHDQLASYHQPLWPNITLLTMPRVFGYVFNPVSFWLCRDEQQQLRAVICEVNNTFGETHSYLCLPDCLPDCLSENLESEYSTGIIDDNMVLSAEKIFHVSPFLPRRGKYDFRFHLSDSRCDIFIDYCDFKNQTAEIINTLNNPPTDKSDFEKVLLTSLRGEFAPLSRKALMQAFWRCPFVTLKAITLIHVQALKIIFKKIKYIKKPPQLATLHSATHHINQHKQIQTVDKSTVSNQVNNE